MFLCVIKIHLLTISPENSRKSNVGVKNIFFTLVLCCISFAAAFGIAEMIVRYMHLAPKNFHITMNVHRQDLEGEYQVSNNPILLYEPKPNSGAFNSFGIRGKPIPAMKSRPRMAILGDSVGYGINLKYEETFSGLLAKKFKGDIEVYNFSVPGYSFNQYIEVLFDKVVQHDIDYLLVAMCYNDFWGTSNEFDAMRDMIAGHVKNGDISSRDLAMKFNKRSSWGNWLYLNSELYRYISFYFLEGNKAIDSTDKLTNMTAGVQNTLNHLFTRLKDASVKYGFKVSVLFLPQGKGDRSYENFFLKPEWHAKKNKINTFNLHKLLYRTSAIPEIVEMFLNNDDCHFSPIGHKYVSDFIADEFDMLFFSKGSN